MDNTDDLIQRIVAQQMGRVAQARQNSINFDKRIDALRLERDYERTSAHIANSTDLAARMIPSVASQHSRQQRGLYDTNIGMISRPEMIRNEIISGFRDLHHYDPSGNDLMNPPLQSRVSCRICGRWPFSNHVELLLHESSCSVNFTGDAMIPRQHVPNNETLIRHSINRDIVSDINMSLAKGIARKLAPVPSSLPIRYSTSTSTSGNCQEAASSAQLSDSLSLAIPDEERVTSLQHFVSRHCVEFFIVSTYFDICLYSSNAKGQRIHAGQIGIRCPHCHKIEDKKESGINSRDKASKGSVYFPPAITSIYSATLDLLQHHTHVCEYVPRDIMKRYNELNASDASSVKSRQYWIERAKVLGLVDTGHGIQSSSCTSLMIPSESSALPPVTLSDSHLMTQKTDDLPLITDDKRNIFRDIEGGPLVDPKYKYLATDYTYALLSQVQACTFLESDRRNKRKHHPIGFAGLACSHCYSEHGCGRFFPSNIKTMSDTSKTLDVLHSHMLRCQQCPLRVKVGLQTLRLRHDEERSKMRFGSQKAFFVCIWKRLHGETPSDNAKVPH